MTYGEDRCTVLVADDDTDIRETLAELLKLSGYHVLQAANGKQALESVAEHSPTVMLLDHRMPEMSGAEVCRTLQAKGSLVRIIFATAAKEGPELAKSLGVNSFLAKPFNLDSCLSAVAAACE